jgi:hypothetical protein
MIKEFTPTEILEVDFNTRRKDMKIDFLLHTSLMLF